MAVTERTESITEQIARAQSLLAASLGQLRESFVAIAAAGPAAFVAESSRHHFERAVIALQSEDTVWQLLEHARERVVELEQAIAQARALLGPSDADPERPLAQASWSPHHDARVTEVLAVLQAPGVVAQPVRQSAVAPGPTQLF